MGDEQTFVQSGDVVDNEQNDLTDDDGAGTVVFDASNPASNLMRYEDMNPHQQLAEMAKLTRQITALQDEVRRQNEEGRKMREALEAANRGPRQGLELKVSDKHGLSVYGLGRFPLTLYRNQWLQLFGLIDQVKKFIADDDAKPEHQRQLAQRPPKPGPKPQNGN